MSFEKKQQNSEYPMLKIFFHLASCDVVRSRVHLETVELACELVSNLSYVVIWN